MQDAMQGHVQESEAGKDKAEIALAMKEGREPNLEVPRLSSEPFLNDGRTPNLLYSEQRHVFPTEFKKAHPSMSNEELANVINHNVAVLQGLKAHNADKEFQA